MKSQLLLVLIMPEHLAMFFLGVWASSIRNWKRDKLRFGGLEIILTGFKPGLIKGKKEKARRAWPIWLRNPFGGFFWISIWGLVPGWLKVWSQGLVLGGWRKGKTNFFQILIPSG